MISELSPKHIARREEPGNEAAAFELEGGTVCAIVVTFNPDSAELGGLVQQIESHRCDFLVVDNGSSNAEDFVHSLETLPRCVGVLALDVNRGLAAGINLGLRRVSAAGYRLALLFDQDSRIGPGFCGGMLEAWRAAALHGGDRIAAIGPRLQDPETGRRTPFKEFDRLLFRTDRKVDPGGTLFHTGFLVTSGTLLSLSHLEDIGMMREDYFIDNVDLEWCFRALAKGYVLYGTDRAVLHHRVGEPARNVLERRGLIARHSPHRAYYTTRNRINLYRQPYAPVGWKIRDLIRFVIKSSWLLMTSKRRAEYWRNIRRGIRDAGKLE